MMMVVSNSEKISSDLLPRMFPLNFCIYTIQGVTCLIVVNPSLFDTDIKTQQPNANFLYNRIMYSFLLYTCFQ